MIMCSLWLYLASCMEHERLTWRRQRVQQRLRLHADHSQLCCKLRGPRGHCGLHARCAHMAPLGGTARRADGDGVDCACQLQGRKPETACTAPDGR